MKIRGRQIRLLSQAGFLIAFGLAFAALSQPRVPGPLASILLAFDPLTAIGVAMADWTIPGLAWLGLVGLGLTAILGRVFCGWLCPLGTLQHLVAWLASLTQPQRLRRNRYRSWFAIKYLVLTVLLSWAALGANHLGWLDPIPLLNRAVAAGLRPLWQGGIPGGWIPLALVVTILALSAWMPRFFCRVVCPLGALLGLFARLAPVAIRRDPARCTGCQDCLLACAGGADPQGQHRISECHVCLNCIPACGESLGYTSRYPVPAVGGDPATGDWPAEPGVGVGRRRFLLSVIGSVALGPVLRATGGGLQARHHTTIRPPGALAEEAFLARCITCGACVGACPTGGLIPDLGRSGVEGLLTPVLVPRRGWCEPSCTRCAEVCPTQALVTPEPSAKQAIGGPALVRIGTAFVDRGRCLPWAMSTPCIVCEEMCPTSPKAIWLESASQLRHDQTRIEIRRPHLDPELCTGCGLCENRCPVGERAAIRVSSIGESRDPRNALLQRGVGAGSDPVLGPG